MKYILLLLSLIGFNCFALSSEQNAEISSIIEGKTVTIPFCTPSWTCIQQEGQPVEDPTLTIIFPEPERVYIRKDKFGVLEIWQYLQKGEVQSFTIEDHQTFNLNSGEWE